MTPSPPPDPELLELVEECRKTPVREAAWERFHARYSHLVKLIVNATARTATTQDREDMCQAIWVRMPKTLDRFDPNKGALPRFLQVMAERMVRSEWRRRQRERDFLTPVDERVLALVKQSPEEQDPALLRTLIFDFLRSNVNDDKKLQVYESWIEGLNYKEIMKIHGLSRPVVFRRFRECEQLVRWALGLAEKE